MAAFFSYVISSTAKPSSECQLASGESFSNLGLPKVLIDRM